LDVIGNQFFVWQTDDKNLGKDCIVSGNRHTAGGLCQPKIKSMLGIEKT
jgi:hypothetical protein